MHVTITWSNDPISAIYHPSDTIALNRWLDDHDCLLDNAEFNRLMNGYDVHIDTTHNNEVVTATITLVNDRYWPDNPAIRQSYADAINSVM